MNKNNKWRRHRGLEFSGSPRLMRPLSYLFFFIRTSRLKLSKKTNNISKASWLFPSEHNYNLRTCSYYSLWIIWKNLRTFKALTDFYCSFKKKSVSRLRRRKKHLKYAPMAYINFGLVRTVPQSPTLNPLQLVQKSS